MDLLQLEEFIIDTIAEQHGHKILRLPPYHCQYNPIEIWAYAKPIIASLP